MNTSEHINEIAAAMAKAQAVIANPAKDKINPHFKSKYADLAAGLDCIRPALSAQAIAIFQVTEIVDDGVILRTRLAHASGQWIESTYPVSKTAQHQAMGAALTYAKRQALFSLVGVCGDEDDDGNEASKADTRIAPPTLAKTTSVQDSAALAEQMLTSLDMCGSKDSLRAWVAANRANKQRLLPADQEAVSNAYAQTVRNLEQPMAQAAE